MPANNARNAHSTVVIPRGKKDHAMNTRRSAVSFAIAAALITLGASASSARAQGAPKIATASPARIFVEMKETKDLRQQLEAQTGQLQNDAKNRQQKVKDLQAARDLLKPDSPQYAEAERAFMQEAIQFDTWTKITQAQLQGQQKQQMKQLFDKIVAATAEVAQQQGYDLVLADQRPELPENLGMINVEQLRQLLNQRNVLFENEKVDISSAVIANLDSKYNASGGSTNPAGVGAAGTGGTGGVGAPPTGGTGASPAPAPAPAPKK
jgi:Skp family chaperone for outer membrane proteins